MFKKWAWHFGAALDNITAGNLLSFSRFLGFVWFPIGNQKKTKYLENEERCHGVSHILTRYRFIGFFGSWLGGGLSLSPSIVKVRVAGWWSLSVSFYR